jgi:archaetidylinositol phosphate synthase
VLDNKRNLIDPLLSICAKKFLNIKPDILSWISFIFAFFSGILFYLSSPKDELSNFYLIFAAIFVFFNGFFDALDGKVAKLTNKTSQWGDFLDHSLDRYADVFIVGGIALSPWISRSWIGLIAIIGMLLTSYMGTQSQAIGYKREYSGLLGRADRLVFLIVFAIIQHLSIGFITELPFNTTFLDWVLIYFAIIGNITAIQRFYITRKWLQSDKKIKK